MNFRDKAFLRIGLVATLLLSPVCASSEAVPAPLEAETASTAVIRTPQTRRAYLPDLAGGHLIDSRGIVIDVDKLEYLASVPTGMDGFIVPNPQRSEVYVATTYLARGTRGDRTDVVEIYDADSLTLKGEVLLPPNRAQAVDYAPYLRPSSDGSYLFIQNITPASSVAVVDLKTRKAIAEVDTAGCAGIYPSPNVALRISSLCGDGTMLTISLAPDGTETARQRSKKLFDAEVDPLFIGDAATNKGAAFVSFQGMVHEVDLTGPIATQSKPWSLVGSEDKTWRPGGYQVIAIDRTNGQLFVAMHGNGKEGSHKRPADEIWQFDLASAQRVARVPGEHAVAIGVTQGDHLVLIAVDGINGALSRFDISGPMTKTGSLASIVESPTAIIMP